MKNTGRRAKLKAQPASDADGTGGASLLREEVPSQGISAVPVLFAFGTSLSVFTNRSERGCPSGDMAKASEFVTDRLSRSVGESRGVRRVGQKCRKPRWPLVGVARDRLEQKQAGQTGIPGRCPGSGRTSMSRYDMQSDFASFPAPSIQTSGGRSPTGSGRPC